METVSIAWIMALAGKAPTAIQTLLALVFELEGGEGQGRFAVAISPRSQSAFYWDGVSGIVDGSSGKKFDLCLVVEIDPDTLAGHHRHVFGTEVSTAANVYLEIDLEHDALRQVSINEEDFFPLLTRTDNTNQVIKPEDAAPLVREIMQMLNKANSE
jgi:hypothetical protein